MVQEIHFIDGETEAQSARSLPKSILPLSGGFWMENANLT